MELMDICGVTSTGDTNKRVNTRSKALHKRLRLRKTVVEPSTMQREDKSGPKKIAEEREHGAAWASSKSSQEAERSPETLRFACSKCRAGLEYAPKDLVRHFEDKHKGSPPVFPCPMCTFNTHEFSSLQVHLLSHKDTFSSCCICKDNVQRTWSEFSAHLSVRHCRSGKYFCEICPAFSTGEVQVFQEHLCVHDGAEHTKDKNRFGPKATAQRLRCQHCDYQAAQKWLIAKHIKAVHVCQGGNERKKKKKEEEVNSIVVKPNDPIPKMKPRLTRSAVREMCWLTQDCLSLPGREFLDKYCHLSDPQTTLEEAQQLLMKSVARETGDQKWTNALKTVLSNVPQDAGLHPKSENGLVLNTDLTVLTVKNKITVAPNGASYSRRLKRATPPDREAALPESAAAATACCVADQTGCQASLSDVALCTQAEIKPHNDVTALAPDEAFECAPMQENRENRELETLGERGKRQEATGEDGNHLTSEPQLANEHEVQPSVRKVPPRKKKRRSQRWKRKTRFKRVDKSSSALKIVLKKNPVKGKQWVSQSSLSTSGDLCNTIGKTMKVSQNASLPEANTPEVDLPDTSGGLTSVSQLEPGVELGSSCAAKPAGSTDTNGNETVALQGSMSEHHGTHGGAETSPQSLTLVNRSSSGKTDRSDSRPAAETCCEPAGAQTGSSEDETKAATTDGVTPPNSYSMSSPVCQPVITSQGKMPRWFQHRYDG